ncbi:P-loop containing nucleoside triphosphate hydrolase protein [Hyaloraphidium curvatum]|nr:P-loop containing nucleoside triphosphate hydrolase protein [Hyaloraphidium curvatum]
MTVIKYGQTNSGKTTSSESFVAGLWTAVFGDGAAGEAEVTALELYGEKLADLLSADPSAHKMMGTEAADQLLANLTRESAASAADFAALHARVSALRVSRPTQRSPLSSRSHLIFRVRIGISLVTLVDLAGSEAPALAADQEAFAEATRINSSLLALGMCVEERRKGGFVLYRRHALTRLLEAGLTRGQLRIVACVSPFLRDQRDTQRTLAFGTKARQLKMAPELPVAVDDEEDLRVMVESQRSRIEELDRELETRRSRTEELEKELAELRSLLPAATPSASQDAGVASGTQQADNDEASGGLCTDLQVADLESASTSAEHSAAAMVDANVQELAFEEPAMAAELELASPEDSSTEPTPARAELPIPVDAGDDWMDEPTFDPSDVSRFVSRRDVNGLCAAFASLPDRTRADLVRTLASEAVRWKEQAEKLRYNLNVAETRGVLGLHGEVPRRRTEPRPRAPEVPAQTGKEDSRERVPGRGKENVEPMAPLQAIAPDLGLRALVSGTIAEARSRRARVRDAA